MAALRGAAVGVFDEGTGRALIAYRKMTGLARIAYAGSQVFERLQHGAGRFHVRYPQDGSHVEADLTKQVLAEIEPGGRVRSIYMMSSGKPSTPTVIGHFNVYLKTPGTNSEGMVDSNYFIRGYAIHGYAEVPTYAASHGCLRVPIPTRPRSSRGCRRACRWTSTTKAAAAAATCARTPVPEGRTPAGPERAIRRACG